MNALTSGIAALRVICPHNIIYLPALLSIVVGGDWVALAARAP